MMTKESLKIVYMGTPDFAVESLRALVKGGYNIAAVVTMPDKPMGRHGSVLQPSPVKQYALEQGLKIMQPANLKDPQFIEELRSLHKLIKKITWDIENFSFNTSIPAFMIAQNELSALKCSKRAILEPIAVLLAPYAPHIAEEMWHMCQAISNQQFRCKRIVAGVQRSVSSRGHAEISCAVQRQGTFHARVPEGHSERGSGETCSCARRHIQISRRQHA